MYGQKNILQRFFNRLNRQLWVFSFNFLEEHFQHIDLVTDIYACFGFKQNRFGRQHDLFTLFRCLKTICVSLIRIRDGGNLTISCSKRYVKVY